MHNFFKETGNAFLGGLIGSGLVFSSLFLGNIWGLSIASVIKSGLGAIALGFCTAYGKHLFNQYQLKRQNKKDGKRKDIKTSERA